jgi:hypothetical protein
MAGVDRVNYVVRILWHEFDAISSESAMTTIALERVIPMARNSPIISAALCHEGSLAQAGFGLEIESNVWPQCPSSGRMVYTKLDGHFTLRKPTFRTRNSEHQLSTQSAQRPLGDKGRLKPEPGIDGRLRRT